MLDKLVELRIRLQRGLEAVKYPTRGMSGNTSVG